MYVSLTVAYMVTGGIHIVLAELVYYTYSIRFVACGHRRRYLSTCVTDLLSASPQPRHPFTPQSGARNFRTPAFPEQK